MQEPGTTSMYEFIQLIRAGGLIDTEVLEIIKNLEEVL
jgi:hypothetical protein